MVLNIISDYKMWRRSGFEVDDGVLNLPASISALLGLGKDKKNIITTSALLEKDDYQSVWRETLLMTWQLIQDSQKKIEQDKPDIILIHAYSIYLLICEISILEKALNKCCDKYGINEVRIEDLSGFETDGRMFWQEWQPAYFHEVARSWAQARKIKLTMVRGNKISSFRPEQERRSMKYLSGFFRNTLRLAIKVFARLRDRYLISFFSRVVNLFYILKGGRKIIFYLPFSLAGLYESSPEFAVNIEPFVSKLLFIKHIFLKKKMAPSFYYDEDAISLISSLENKIGWKNKMLKERFIGRLNLDYEDGRFIYDIFTSLIRHMKKFGFETAFLAVGFNIDFSPSCSSYIAEAFRKSGQKVASATHGGNTRLVKKTAGPW